MGDFAVGDRVKVTLEGEVVSMSEIGPSLTIKAAHGREHKVWYDRADVSVEKLEPPVEVFTEPGTALKPRRHSNPAWFLILEDGYTTPDGHHYGKGYFDSEDYERISLAEVPF